MARWRVQFIFQDGDGKARVTEEIVKADSRDAAAKIAADIQPTRDCVFSVHEESADQFLGTVRPQALGRAGKSWAPTGEED
jgi:hypothetical protein